MTDQEKTINEEVDEEVSDEQLAMTMLFIEKKFLEQQCTGGESAIRLFDIAIKALEKQMPEEPILNEYNFGDKYDTDVVCPNCKALLGNVGDIEQGEIMKIPFCWNCGQALSWESEETE